ncbi:hypothetical protein BKA67DRAFT_96879 [Truncatella angustata]|uniref:AA1-like domain-containing protein n=1 Tax=Truncatella angustata TaxID=152316 RepID=A0A9P8RN63_9PEZI|nr:uncharacterized protein BKA67DRAFT_96879 [Truncatella angustata]KAH6646226.1 hypothetical protein BKA67DRAFT_96879 [Truncatella angustata]KAH8203967.1 hypothetical protein TruAng_001909 [Truncatella angustata]
MHSSGILTSVLAVVPLALSHPLNTRDAQDFTITSLSATFPYPYPPYGLDSVDSFVSIAVSYPDVSSTSGGTLSTTCRVDWPAGTSPGSTNWTTCGDGALQFRLPADGWTSTTNFGVELFETVSADGSGLDASHILTSNPGNPSDPNAFMFCLQKGKFNPLTCTLTGPYGVSARTVVLTATEESVRPN